MRSSENSPIREPRPDLIRRRLLSALACLPALGVSAAQAAAPSLAIVLPRLELDPESNAYLLAGDVQLNFSPDLAEAIRRGVGLTFESEFTVTKRRWWWWDREVHTRRRLASLALHTVTGRFRVVVDSTPPMVFVDLTEALRASLAIQGWPVLLNHRFSWTDRRAWIRLRLKSEALPKALQVDALTDRSWELDSGWVEVEVPRG